MNSFVSISSTSSLRPGLLENVDPASIKIMSPTADPGARWEFVQNGTTGIIGLESIVISPTLAVLFDRVENDPLQINGAGAWGAFWNFVTNEPTPISLVSDTFCGSGGFLSNGTLVSVGGEIVENPTTEPDVDGRMSIRLMEPCTDPNGVGCHVFDNPAILHLAETRWYPSSLRIFDGSLMVVGGIHYPTGFYNTDPVNSFEFFPSKDGGVPRSSAFLERSLPVNLFPRVFALPDGKVLMIANNQTIIYDVETNTETQLPDIPNGVRVTNPMDGTATLLPLSPPDYVAEVLVCGGSNSSDTAIPLVQLSSQDPASDQCSRLVITPEGIKRGWVVEHMPVERIMPEMVLLPDGKVLIINGGRTGYAAIDSVADAINGASNADHPVFTPVLYTPDAPAGERFDDSMMPTSQIARLYHSTVTLTPNGNMFIAGSNPNGGLNSTNEFPSEFRVEYLNPPYMSLARPALRNVPSTIAFNQAFTVDVDIPAGLDVTNVQVALMDLGFSTHAFHSSSRLVFMDAKLASDRKSMTITSPPNNRVYPPGPATLTIAAPAPSGQWTLVQNGTTGIVALETVVVSPTLALMFDRAQNDPLQLGNFSAWGALWNFETNTASPVSLISDSFCASGGFLSNGTMVGVGGQVPESPATEPDADGRMMIRLFDPCTDPNGVGCKVIENPATLHLTTTRWYPSSLRIFDGSLMVIGGIHESTPFYNNDSVSSFEFFPPKDNGTARPSAFLNFTLPANLFPRGFALPDGRIFMVANNRTMIYDVETNTEIRLPDIPNGVRVTNPFDGTATLLPLSPPLYTPEILVCGGSNASDSTPSEDLSSQDPASSQCNRIEVTPEGIERGWVVEHMPGGRIMPEMVLLPDGRVLIINGAATGYAAIDSVADAIDGQSNADHPVLRPVIYDPSAPAGERFSDEGLPTSEIARVYHSTVTLTPSGNIFVGGSNPNQNPNIVNNSRFPTEFHVEYLNPPYMDVERPQLLNVPSTLPFNHVFTVSVICPPDFIFDNVQVALIDLGYSTHAFHSSARLVFLDATFSPDWKSITIKTPPNNRVYPPGPVCNVLILGWIYLTVDGVTSIGAQVLMGNGKTPPVEDQGVPLQR
ncbi:hypothetical protein H0H92_013131 [Tricholoma furcatifolium]|nr:hypothetical protein H0H92_013131 [Tricholoma furcatifolium]